MGRSADILKCSRSDQPDNSAVKECESQCILIICPVRSLVLRISSICCSTAQYRRGQERTFTYLVDGETDQVHLTNAQLDEQARAVAAKLVSMGLAGERALLLYPAGLDFIAAFFGCLYSWHQSRPRPARRRNDGHRPPETLRRSGRSCFRPGPHLSSGGNSHPLSRDVVVEPRCSSSTAFLSNPTKSPAGTVASPFVHRWLPSGSWPWNPCTRRLSSRR